MRWVIVAMVAITSNRANCPGLYIHIRDPHAWAGDVSPMYVCLAVVSHPTIMCIYVHMHTYVGTGMNE